MSTVSASQSQIHVFWKIVSNVCNQFFGPQSRLVRCKSISDVFQRWSLDPFHERCSGFSIDAPFCSLEFGMRGMELVVPFMNGDNK